MYLSEKMQDRTLGQLASGTDQSPLERLSDRELEVFEQIGMGSTTREIAAKLSLSPKTIESYRENLKAKLRSRQQHRTHPPRRALGAGAYQRDGGARRRRSGSRLTTAGV